MSSRVMLLGVEITATEHSWIFSTSAFPGLDPVQGTPVPVSYTKYVTKHMSKIEMGE